MPFKKQYDSLSSEDLFRKFHIDLPLLTAFLILFSISLIAIYSASNSDINAVIDQSIRIGISLAAMILIAQMSPLDYERIAPWLYSLCFILLGLVLILGETRNGATRWLNIGISFQPSELIKVFVIVSLADYCCRSSVDIRNFRAGIVLPSVVLGVIALLLLREPDYGCTAVILVTVLGMLFLSGIRLIYFCGAFIAVLVAMSVLIFFNPNRLQRVLCFLDPFAEPYGCGYQLVQALIALGSGEWSGVGLGASVQKLFYLPEASNDFLVAVIGEELGLIGIAVLIVLYASLCWRAFRIADRAGRLGQMFQARVAQGIGLLLTLQVMVNLAVNLGVIPTKGLTLPLMSYGGSSMISCCFAIGLLLAVDRSSQRALGTKR